MHRYSLSVALLDFLPVAVSAFGLLLLARAIGSRHRALAPVALVAALLVTAGGLCKASWKLIVALNEQDIRLLDHLLFICLAPGFVAMGYCLFHTRKSWQQGLDAASVDYSAARLLLWVLSPLAAAALAATLWPETRRWFFLLLAVTTAANAWLILQLLQAARWCQLPWPVSACFIYNFSATLALSGLSRLPAGEYTAWIQEGVNLTAQAALAMGLWHLSGRMRTARTGVRL